MKIIKYALICLFFIYSVVFFAPKASLYYLAEKELAKHEIFLSDEKIYQKPYELLLENIKVLFEEIVIGEIKTVDAKVYLAYNAFSIKEAKLVSNSFKLFPKKLDSLDIVYSLKDPLHVNINSMSDLGEITGAYDLKTQTLQLILKPKKRATAQYQEILKNFKAMKGGLYSYEKVIQFY